MTPARPVRGPHLDARVSALADGHLEHDQRDRALAHAADCSECLAALDAERRTRAQLAALPAPELPAGLLDRLLAVADAPLDGSGAGPDLAADGRAGERPRTPGWRGGPVTPRPGVRRDAARPAGAGRAAGRRSRTAPRRVTAAAGILMAAGATLGVVLTVSAPTGTAPGPASASLESIVAGTGGAAGALARSWSGYRSVGGWNPQSRPASTLGVSRTTSSGPAVSSPAGYPAPLVAPADDAEPVVPWRYRPRVAQIGLAGVN